MNTNLETLIKTHAESMAERMTAAAREAGSEEDVRHACNALIDEFINKAELDIKGQHERGLAGGRIDSKYGGVIIEYKDPKGAGRITENKNAPGARAVVEQLKKRFRDFQAEEPVEVERIFGVGCDGDTLVFARRSGDRFDVENPQPVTPHTVERLLRAIVSLGARGLSFAPENLTAHFGSESQGARIGVRLIHELLRKTSSSKARIFFDQWRILFGVVCGYDLHGQNPKVRKLAEQYGASDSHPAELLFAVHTWYAIFMKMLAAEIVASFSPVGIYPIKRIASAPTSAKLRDELRNLEQGGIWSQSGVRNFLEGDLFSWYLDAWSEDCADAVRAMTRSFDQFDPATLSVDPAESRDLLKQLYQQLFPKSVRHDLGEYYTPDWLAEFTLDELGYDGDPDKRLLDPACGSGTFLVTALNRVRGWFDAHRHECGFGEEELLRRILRNVIGFDLNPLAVMAARTNYLMAVRDLLRHAGEVELPVYLCDSIMTPSEYGELQAGRLGEALRLNTSAGDFSIPVEITESREHIGRYADALEFCIRNGYSPEEFLERCEAEAMPATKAGLHEQLYRDLQRLDAENKNGRWARVIKNAFAPLFIGRVDYVAGNPPWVNWEHLPDGYRDAMKPLWQEYRLFTLSGSEGRLGGGKKDLSMLFTYAAVDNYLEKDGRLGFVITQSVFKTQGAGDGFRQLRYVPQSESKEGWILKPIIVHDLSAMQVFEGAINLTAVFVGEKTKRPFAYPVPYAAWAGRSRIPQAESLESVRRTTSRREMEATPLVSARESSPWLTAPKRALPGIQKVIGASDYRAYAGCCTWLNGVYWINVLEVRPNGELLIENLHDVGKLKVDQVHAVIEPELAYPLLRGRDVHRWRARPSAHIILAQDPQTRKGIPEPEMKRRWPKTFAYLKRFEGDPKKPARGTLRGRSGYRRYFKPSDPFYSMYNVGPYTMAEWKALWPEVGHSVRASACGSRTVEKAKPSLPDHTIVAVSCGGESEAHFVVGMLNSSPAHAAVAAYIVLHPSPHIMKNIAVPRFRETDDAHARLADLSLQCHDAASGGEETASLEAGIDELAARVWGIGKSELKAIQKALADV